MALTPRRIFQSNADLRDKSLKLVHSDWFPEFLEAALSEHSRQTLEAPIATSDQCFHQLTGAREFANLLLSLPEAAREPREVLTHNLDHTA